MSDRAWPAGYAVGNGALRHGREAYLAMGIEPIYHPLKVYPGTTS